MNHPSDELIHSLTLFHAYSTALHRANTLPDLLETLVMRAVQLVRSASAGCFVEYDDAQDAFTVQHTYGYAYPTLMEQIAFSDEESRFYEVMENHTPDILKPASLEREIPWLPNISWDLYKEANQGRVPGEVIVVPVNAPEKSLGVLVVERFGDGEFSPHEAQLLNAFARQATLAIHKVQLYQENIRIAKELDQELQSVGEVQKNLLPHAPPDSQHFDIFTYYQPATRAGGDYFDFIPLSDGQFAFVIADVTGHGAPAAVIAAMTKVILHNQFLRSHEPDQVLIESHHQICQFIDSQYFVTLFLGIFQPEARRMVYCSAGHEPPLHFHRATGALSELRNERGFPLRLTEANAFDVQSAAYEPGDVFFFYTDGITEMFNDAGRIYSFEQLYNSILSAPKESAAQLGGVVLDRLKQFRGKEPLHDDITLVVIRCK